MTAKTVMIVLPTPPPSTLFIIMYMCIIYIRVKKQNNVLANVSIGITTLARTVVIFLPSVPSVIINYCITKSGNCITRSVNCK
jgi:hypothetical protein